MSQTDPKRGEVVRVWPTHAHVPVNGNGGAFLVAAGKAVPWSPWWAQRLRDGDVTLADPTPPAPVVAPIAPASPTSSHKGI